MRDDPAANSGADRRGHQREVILLETFLVTGHYAMQPRSHSDPAAKPASAFAMVASVRRCHARHGITMARAPRLALVLKGLLRLYTLAHGPESLQPRRKEPLTNEHTRAILGIPTGTVIDNVVVDWKDPVFIAFAALLTTLRHAGARKADLIPPAMDTFSAPLPAVLEIIGQLPELFVQHADADIGRLSAGGGFPSRNNLRWLIDGEHILLPTHAQLRSLKPKDCAIWVPGGSKADPQGLEFGTKPVYLPYQNDPINAAKRLADLELAMPVVSRPREPMFPIDCDGGSLHHQLADKLFRALAVFALGATVAKTLSLHAGRIWLACAFMAKKHRGPVIQAFCRWKSPESVLIYARANPHDYAATLESVLDADTSAITPHDMSQLPQLDHDDKFAQLAADVDNADNAGARAVPAAATDIAQTEPARAAPVATSVGNIQTTAGREMRTSARAMLGNPGAAPAPVAVTRLRGPLNARSTLAAKRKHHATSSDNGDAPIEPSSRAAPAAKAFVDSYGTAGMAPIDHTHVGTPIDASAGIGQIMATDLFTASGEVKWFRCKLAKHKKAWPSVRFDSGKLGAVSWSRLRTLSQQPAAR
jgi:hypothetical protein